MLSLPLLVRTRVPTWLLVMRYSNGFLRVPPGVFCTPAGVARGGFVGVTTAEGVVGTMIACSGGGLLSPIPGGGETITDLALMGVDGCGLVTTGSGSVALR